MIQVNEVKIRAHTYSVTNEFQNRFSYVVQEENLKIRVSLLRFTLFTFTMNDEGRDKIPKLTQTYEHCYTKSSTTSFKKKTL